MSSSSESHLEQRKEEIEVLSSIFEDLIINNEEEDKEELVLRTLPENPSDEFDHLIVNLRITYTKDYPDELPMIKVEPIEGEFKGTEENFLIEKLIEAGNDSIGMVMVFNLSLTLQNLLNQILSDRLKNKLEEEEKVQRLKQIEEDKLEIKNFLTEKEFLEWRKKFDEERSKERQIQQEESLKSLSFKEKEDLKKNLNKLTGKQLFESNVVNIKGNLFDQDEGEDEDEENDSDLELDFDQFKNLSETKT